VVLLLVLFGGMCERFISAINNVFVFRMERELKEAQKYLPKKKQQL